MHALPEGWREVPSSIEGIRVFAPPPPSDDTPDEPAVFRCPSCGSPTAFSPAVGAVACGACDWHEARTTAAATVGTNAEVHEFTLEALQRAQHGWGVSRRELGCDSCGARLTLEEGHLAASCPFCASNQVRIQDGEDTGLRPAAVVPFKITSRDLPARLAEFLGQGWMHPADLSKAVRAGSFSGVYIPYWLFSAEVHSSWEAEVGHTETETVWRNGEMETTTEIVWRWESGHHSFSEHDMPVPGTALMSEILMARLLPWSADDLVPYEPRWLAGFEAMVYDVGLLEAWETGKSHLREQARSGCVSQASTNTIRNLSVSSDLDHEKWRYVLLPVWVSTYTYEGKTWQVLVNGQSGEFAGQKPVAWWKIWTAIGVLLTPGLTLMLVSIPLAIAGVGLFTGLIGLIITIAGGVGSYAIFNSATKAEMA